MVLPGPLVAPAHHVALHAVVMQSYVDGVSNRRVDHLVVLGGAGISRMHISRLWASMAARRGVVGARRVEEQALPYVFCYAACCKIPPRRSGRLARGCHATA